MNNAQLSDLGRILRVIGEHGENLSPATADGLLAEIGADLVRALEVHRQVNGPKPTTRCRQHPFGAVDEEARDLCLLCETRRRRSPEWNRVSFRPRPDAVLPEDDS